MITDEDKIIITRAILEGATLKEMAAKYNRSRERMRQIFGKKMRQIGRGDVARSIRKARDDRDALLGKLLRGNNPGKNIGTINENTPISEIETSVRAANCLRNAGIETVGELISVTRKELLSIKNLGEETARNIESLLYKYGYRLRTASNVESKISIMGKEISYLRKRIDRLEAKTRKRMDRFEDKVGKTYEPPERLNNIEQKMRGLREDIETIFDTILSSEKYIKPKIQYSECNEYLS